MAGELLFRILDRQAFEALSAVQQVSNETAAMAFIDRGNWSLTEPAGEDNVTVEGTGYAAEAPWIYEAHEALEAVGIVGEETATLVTPTAC